MRIVVWNCRMGFAKKRELLLSLQPDIAVVPECSRDAILAWRDEGYDTRWWGDNKHKGLGVLAAKPWTLLDEGERTGKLLAPVRVVGPLNFLLIAVWAGRVTESKERSYPGQIFDAVVEHPQWFDGDRSVAVCGDFNSNKKWDKERKIRNHSAVVKLLRDRNLVSAYHTFFSEEQGEETKHTHFHRCSEDPQNSYHIDYIFVSDSWRIRNVAVGTYEKWCRTMPRSDHAPIIVDIGEQSD